MMADHSRGGLNQPLQGLVRLWSETHSWEFAGDPCHLLHPAYLQGLVPGPSRHSAAAHELGCSQKTLSWTARELGSQAGRPMGRPQVPQGKLWGWGLQPGLSPSPGDPTVREAGLLPSTRQGAALSVPPSLSRPVT